MSVMRTLVFGLHAPSNTTAALLLRALRAYTTAARAVLDAARDDWPRLKEWGSQRGALNARTLQQALGRRYRRRTTRYPLHSSLRDALFADLAAQLVAYDALCRAWEDRRARVREHLAFLLDDPNRPLTPAARDELTHLGRPPSWPSLPRTRPDNKGYAAALEAMARDIPDALAPPQNGESLQRDERLRHLLTLEVTPRARAASHHPSLSTPLKTALRPLLFPRPDGATQQRNFGLLRTPDGRYYAELYLLPKGDARARPRALPADRRGPARAVHPSAAVVPRDTGEPRRAVTSIVLPLACGAWHERTLALALARPEMVRTASLAYRPARATARGRRPAGFALSVTFEHEVPVPLDVTTHMGVSIDRDGRVGWAVIDPGSGRIVATGRDNRLANLAPHWREDRRAHQRDGRLPPRAHTLQRTQATHATHALCNELVALAVKHHAQLALQNIGYMRARRPLVERDESGQRSSERAETRDAPADARLRPTAAMTGAPARLLGYKLPLAALPRPLMIGGISPRDCAMCEGRGVAPGSCSLCGADLGAENTAVVVARCVADVQRRMAAAHAARTRGARDGPIRPLGQSL